MRFRAKCVEPGQMIALSRITTAIHKLTKAVIMILRSDRITFVMPTSVATFSNASLTSRCVSALLAELEANLMFTDYAVEFQQPSDDGIYMHLDTEHLARAFTLKSNTDRSLSFTIKLSKMGEKPCLVVRREQLSTSMADAGSDMPDASIPGGGINSFFLDHKLGIEWVARRHWPSYGDVPAIFSNNLPNSGIGMPNDLRHIKTVIDRLSSLGKDGKTVAAFKIDPRRHLLSFKIGSISFEAEAEFSDLPVFNCSDYNNQNDQQPLASSAASHASTRTNCGNNHCFEALIDLKRLGEALSALDKITQQTFVPATLAILGLKNRKAVVLVAVLDVGVQLLAAIGTIASQDDEEDEFYNGGRNSRQADQNDENDENLDVST